MRPGNAIQWFREALNLTQDELGDMLEGVSQPNIARYEAGKAEPPLDFWRKFARASGVNLTWAITGQGDPYEGGTMGKAERDRVRHVIQSLYGNYQRKNFNPLGAEGMAAYLELQEWWDAHCKAADEAFEELHKGLDEFLVDPPGAPREAEIVRNAASKRPNTRRQRKVT